MKAALKNWATNNNWTDLGGVFITVGLAFLSLHVPFRARKGKKNADIALGRHHRHHNVQTLLDLPWNAQVLTRHRLFSYGLNTGGPAIMSVGWIIVCFFSMSSIQLLIPHGPELIM